MLEIIREALQLNGHELGNIHYVTNKRMVAMFNNGEVDIIVNPPPNLKTGFPTNSILHFENVVIALSANNFNITGLDDLVDKRLLAFQFAKAYLGPEFLAMTEENERYVEFAQQINQLRHLYLGRTDAIILDRGIFLYYLEKLSQQMDVSEAISYFSLFPRVPRYISFLDGGLASEFNESLKVLERSGRRQQIIDSYFYQNRQP